MFLQKMEGGKTVSDTKEFVKKYKEKIDDTLNDTMDIKTEVSINQSAENGDEDFISIDVISSDDIDNSFPWNRLSEESLRDKLELLYEKYVKDYVGFSRGIARAIRKMQMKELIKPTDRLFNSNIIIPVVSEKIIIDVAQGDDVEKIKKNAKAHRELIFRNDENYYDLVEKTYIPNFSEFPESNIFPRSILVSVRRDIIDRLDLSRYGHKDIDQRMAKTDENVALVGYLLDANLIGKSKYNLHTLGYMANEGYLGTKEIRNIIVNDFGKDPQFYNTKQIVGLLDDLDNVENDIEKLKITYAINHISRNIEIAKYFKNTPGLLLAITDDVQIFIDIAKVMQKFYPFLAINEYFTSSTFYTEVRNGIDNGRLAFTFSVIVTNIPEIPSKLYTYVYEYLLSTKTGEKLPFDPNLISPGMKKLFINDYEMYNILISNKFVFDKNLETIKARSFKDQIYRSLIWTIYGQGRYNELVTKSKFLKTATIFDIVTASEATTIEERYKEIQEYRIKYNTNQCKHLKHRREYDLLPLDDIKKHDLFFELRHGYAIEAGRLTNEQKNKRQIICKFDGMVIGCEHEFILAQMKKSLYTEQPAFMKILESEYIVNTEEFDAGTCKHCGRTILESKELVSMVEYDEGKSVIIKFGMPIKEIHEIESAVIRAIQKNEPLKNADDITQRIHAKEFFEWDDVRRIVGYCESSILMYYDLISKKQDRYETLYREVSRTCVIYSHIIYETLTFKPESIKYFSTVEHPWLFNPTEKSLEENVKKLLKRSMYMIRLRFFNILLRASKLRQNMFQDYLITIYKTYSKFRAESKTKPILGINKWQGITFKKNWNQVLLEKFENYITDKTSNQHIQIGMAKIAMGELLSDVIDRPEKNIIPRIDINLILGNNLSNYAKNPYVFIMKDEIIEPKVIKPIDYNVHGMPQSWKTRIIKLKNDQKHYEFNEDEYKKITDTYQEFFKNSYNSNNIIPENFILPNDVSIEWVDYKNPNGDLQSRLKSENYSPAQQTEISKYIDMHNTVRDIYAYAEQINNDDFSKTVSDYVSGFDKIKGYLVKNYSELVEKLKKFLTIESGDKNANIINKFDETEIPIPKKIETSSIRPEFKEHANELIAKLYKSLGDSGNTIDMEKKYKKLQILGRKSIQETEEIQKYDQITDYAKELSESEIIDIHTGYQLTKLQSYVKYIYQAANILYYNTDISQMYSTTQSKNLIRFINKLKPDIKKINEMYKTHQQKQAKTKNQKVIDEFIVFKNICFSFIESSKLGAEFIKENLETIFSQEESVNLSYRQLAFEQDRIHAVRQFNYDIERFRKKQINDEFDIFEIGGDQQIDIVDSALNFNDPAPKGNSERRAAYEAHKNDINRIDDNI